MELPETIIRSNENFIKIMNNDIFVKAITLGFWLQDISKKEGSRETLTEFTIDRIGRPFFLGTENRSYGWSDDLSNQGVKDVCMVHTHPKNCTFSYLDINAIEKKHWRYAFAITPDHLHCFYRTKDKFHFNQDEYMRIGIALDRDFEKKTGISLAEFMNGKYSPSKTKEIEKQCDKYIEDVREPELMKLFCNIDGLVFAFFVNIQKHRKELYDDDEMQKESLEKVYHDTKEWIEKNQPKFV